MEKQNNYEIIIEYDGTLRGRIMDLTAGEEYTVLSEGPGGIRLLLLLSLELYRWKNHRLRRARGR